MVFHLWIFALGSALDEVRIFFVNIFCIIIKFMSDGKSLTASQVLRTVQSYFGAPPGAAGPVPTPSLPAVAAPSPSLRLCDDVDGMALSPHAPSQAQIPPPSRLKRSRPPVSHAPVHVPNAALRKLREQLSEPTEFAANLRRLILKSTLHNSVMEYKNQYFYNTATSSSTPTLIALNELAFGANDGERATNCVYMKRLFVKIVATYTANGHSGVPYTPPSLGFTIFNDRLPATPGSAAQIFDLDTLPPVADCLYSQLGNSSTSAYILAQRAPAFVQNYHVYRHHWHHPKGYDFGLNGNAPGSVTQFPSRTTWEFDLTPDIRNMQSIYASDAASAPMTNALWFGHYASTTTSGGSWVVALSYHLAYEDAPSAL